MMNTSRNTHSLALAFSFAGIAIVSAVVTYVDNVNASIPATFGGVYIDLNAKSTGSSASSGAPDPSGDSYTLSYTEPASGEWDFNFFFGGTGIAHHSSANPYRDDASDNLSVIYALGIGELVDGSTATSSGAVPLTTPSFGGSGTGSGGGSGVSTSGSHVGVGADQFAPNTMEHFGFVLDPGTPNEMYGWMKVTFQDDGSAGTIHEFALSDNPFSVGSIPEPSISLLSLSSLLVLIGRRRSIS